MNAARAWFDSRSVRERRLILVMLALGALTLIWAGVIRPLNDALASARTRHADAVVRLGETQARLDAVRVAQVRRSASSHIPLADDVRARAAEAGFTLTSVEPDGTDRVRVAVQSARPGALTAFLARIEGRGILVDSVAFSANADRTVGATLTLRSRGR